MAQTTLTYSDQEYKNAAHDWSKELLLIPVISIADELKYFTGMAEAEGKVALPVMQANMQLAPYKSDRKPDAGLEYIFRQLETFLGSAEADFEPNAYRTLLRARNAATLGDGQMSNPTVKDLLACGMQALGENLRRSLFTARRNAEGNTTQDLFDGWDTIAADEIEAGNISAEKGNLYRPAQVITEVNACDILKAAERKCDPVLRQTQKFLFCDPELKDMYDDSYLATHQGLQYNKDFNQVYLEGSGNLTTIIPLPSMSGLKRAYITPAWNMIYGYQNMGDLTKVDVNRFKSFVLTIAATMWFGTQFYTLDKRALMVIDYSQQEPAQQEPAQQEPAQQEL